MIAEINAAAGKQPEQQLAAEFGPERAWVIRDFKKTARMSVEEWLDEQKAWKQLYKGKERSSRLRLAGLPGITSTWPSWPRFMKRTQKSWRRI
jgi:hypothetical protein